MYFLTTSGTAHERGRQHGAQLAEAIREVHAAWVGEAAMGEAGWLVEHWLREYGGDVCDELAGIAEGAGLPYEQIVHLTLRNSLVGLPSGCTTIVVRGEDGRCVLGKTQDVGPVEARFQLAQEITDEHGRKAVLVGLVGTSWVVCGMNEDGLCAGINSAPTTRDPQTWQGWPQHSALRWLLRESTVGGVRRDWLKVPLVGKGINGCCCDQMGDAFVFERCGRRRAISESGESIYHTNHYRDAGLRRAGERAGSGNSFAREAWLNERLAGRRFADPAAMAWELLQSCGGGAICRPLDAHGTGTQSGYLADPVAGTFAVCDGPPCQGEWRTYRLRD